MIQNSNYEPPCGNDEGQSDTLGATALIEIGRKLRVLYSQFEREPANLPEFERLLRLLREKAASR